MATTASLVQNSVPLNGTTLDVSAAPDKKFLYYAGGSPTDYITVEKSLDGGFTWVSLTTLGPSPASRFLLIEETIDKLRVVNGGGLTGTLSCNWLFQDSVQSVNEIESAVPLAGPGGGPGTPLALASGAGFVFPSPMTFLYSGGLPSDAVGIEVANAQGGPYQQIGILVGATDELQVALDFAAPWVRSNYYAGSNPALQTGAGSPWNLTGLTLTVAGQAVAFTTIAAETSAQLAADINAAVNATRPDVVAGVNALATTLGSQDGTPFTLAGTALATLGGTFVAGTYSNGIATLQVASAENVVSGSGGGPPSGAAGGDLGATYPNPTVVAAHIGAGGTFPMTSASATTWGLSNSDAVAPAANAKSFELLLNAGGAATGGAPGGEGGNAEISTGAGGAASATQVAGNGGGFQVSTGAGGAADAANAAGSAGPFVVAPGTGGAGSAGAPGGSGGGISLAGGAGGADGGGSGGPGGAVSFTGGAGAASTTGAAGVAGTVSITGGQGGNGSATQIGAAGANVVIASGAGGTDAGSGAGVAGTLQLLGNNGQPSVSGAASAGGPVQVQAGTGGAASATGAAGAGGNLSLSSGTGGAGNGANAAGAAGAINLQAGTGGAGTAGTAATAGGAVNLQAGSAGAAVGTNGAAGGAVSVQAGSGTGNGAGGAVIWHAGTGAGSGNGGAVTVNAGNAGPTGTGGAVTFVAGTGASGGAVTFTGGVSNVTGGVGGAVSLTGGAATVGNANGGSVSLAGGAGIGSGTAGAVNLGTDATTRAVMVGASTNKTSTLSPATAAIDPNYIAVESGANNALVVVLTDGLGTNVPLVAGLRISVLLAHTLQAAAGNTISFNTVVKNIKSHLNPANNQAVAYAVGGIIGLVYDGTQWQDMSQ